MQQVLQQPHAIKLPLVNSPSFNALLQMGTETLTSGMNSEVVSN